MSLDNFREYGALILLFRECQNSELKQQVLKLIPELAAWETAQDYMQRWRLRAVSGDGEKLGQKVIVCREGDLPQHERAFRDQFDLATNVKVDVVKQP